MTLFWITKLKFLWIICDMPHFLVRYYEDSSNLSACRRKIFNLNFPGTERGWKVVETIPLANSEGDNSTLKQD